MKRPEIKAMLKEVGAVGDFTVHCARVGAATEAFAYGMSIETIKRLGHWRSMCFLTYCVETIAEFEWASELLASRKVTTVMGVPDFTVPPEKRLTQEQLKAALANPGPESGG